MYGIDEIITDNLTELTDKLTEVFNNYGLKHNIEVTDYDYQLHERMEWIGIPKESYESLFGDLRNKYNLEDNEDFNYFGFSHFLPGKFGVIRGYSGGGVHSELRNGEYHELTEFLEKQGFEKADEFLSEVNDEIRKTFWKIHKDIDSYVEEETGEKVPSWESSSL